MTARQLPIFTDCPFGGCEDGYCACLEQDFDEDLDDPYPEGEFTFVRSRLRTVETVPISIDDYEPPQGT